MAHFNLGRVLEEKGQSIEAAKCYQKALDIRIKSLGNEHLDVATSYNNIAFVHFKNREYEKALSYLHMALSIKEKKLSKDSPSFINTQQAIDMIQKDLNKKNNKP